MKKVIAAATAAVFAVALAIGGAALPASAQTTPPVLAGAATCNTATGTWSVAWSYHVAGIPTDARLDSAVTGYTPSGSTFTTTDGAMQNGQLVLSTTASSSDLTTRSGSFTQTIPAGTTATRAQVKVTTTWSDGTHADEQVTVPLNGPCATPQPVAPASRDRHASPTPSYVVVAWSMPSWVDSSTPSWPQTFAKSVTTKVLKNALDLLDPVLTTCGMQYQIDVYNDTAATAALIAGGSLSDTSADQSESIPGTWGTAYKLFQTATCPPATTPETGTPTFVTASCTAPATSGTHSPIALASFVKTDATTLAGNTVTLPAVPGGVWSWTNTSDSNPASNSGAYPIGEGYSGAPQDGMGTYSYTLTDGDSTDGYLVTGTTTTWTPVDASTLDCTTKATPADPTWTPVVCTNGVTTLGSITVGDEVGLIYSLKDSGGKSIALVNGTASGLAAGKYTVSVVADTAAGYVLDGASDFPFTVTIAGSACQVPTLPAWDAGATGSTAVCLPTGPFGTITLTHSTGQEGKVSYSVLDVASGVSTDVGSTVTAVQEPAGDYVVTATPTVPGDGIAGSTNVFPVTIAAATDDCLPTLAGFDSGVTNVAPTCRMAGGTSGVLTFTTTPGEVDYTITNLATGVATDLGSGTSTLDVDAGSYTVTAKVLHVGDTLFDFGAASGSYPITVAAVATICSTLQTLAYTGVSAGVGFTLAASMLFLGLAGLLMRRRYGRSAR